MRYSKQVVKIVFSSMVILTAGCSPFVENNMIEEIAPVIFWSIDKGKKSDLEISTLVPPLINEKKRLLTLPVDLLKEGEKNFNLVYYRELKVGQLRMLLISEEVAKEGIMPIINTVLTDPDISQRLYLAVVRGGFDEYMNSQIEKQENLDYFLYRMFKHYEKDKQGEMTVVNLHEFKNNLYTPLEDPILPLFEVDKENFTYEGTALFNDDKLIATVQNVEESIMQIIGNDHFLKLLPITELSLSLGHIRANVDMNLEQNNSLLSIDIDLTARIEEYKGDKNIHEVNELTVVGNEIESYLETYTTELLNHLQEWRIDPLEIGSHTKKPFEKPMSEEEWINMFEQMEIEVDYQLNLQPLTNVVIK